MILKKFEEKKSLHFTNFLLFSKKLFPILLLNLSVEKYQSDIPSTELTFMKEYILWSLLPFKKLSKPHNKNGIQIKDPYGYYTRNIYLY